MKVSRTMQFKRDYQLLKEQQGRDLSVLEDVIRRLATPKTLPTNVRPYAYSPSWLRSPVLEVEKDLLLVYDPKPDELVLVRTGSPYDLFH